mgnify:CR=1
MYKEALKYENIQTDTTPIFHIGSNIMIVISIALINSLPFILLTITY